VDNIVSLPEKYFDVNSFNNQEDLEGDNLEYRVEDPLTLSEDYAMPGETRGIISKPATPTRSYANNDTVTKDENEESLDNNTVNNTNVYQAQDNTELLNEIKQLDEKIKNLQNEIQITPTQEIKQNIVNTNLEDSDSTVNVVNKDFFNNNLQNTDNVFNELSSESINNLQNNNADNTNIVQNTKSNINNNDQVLQREINNLLEKREQLLNQFYFKEAQNQNVFDTTNVNNSNTESRVLVDNFTPNFAFVSEEQQEAIDRSVEAENAFGSDPKLVSDSFGNPAVISEDQVDLNTAIDQHGGVDNAIQDSVNQQQYLNNGNLQSGETLEENNTFNNDSKSTIKEGDSALSEENNYENIDNSFYGIGKDDSSEAIKSSGKQTVDAINKLANQFNNLAKAITSGFNSVNGKIKDIGNQSQNNVTNNYKNESSGSSPQMGSKNKSNISPEIRGDTPLKQHFPSNMDLNNLHGNNLFTRV